jgi:hypothetical protein
MTERAHFDFETQVLAKLERLQLDVDSLRRAVRGAAEEGNVGLIARLIEFELAGDERHEVIDARLDALERRWVRLYAYAAGMAAGAGTVGGIIAVLIDKWGLLGP